MVCVTRCAITQKDDRLRRDWYTLDYPEWLTECAPTRSRLREDAGRVGPERQPILGDQGQWAESRPMFHLDALGFALLIGRRHSQAAAVSEGRSFFTHESLMSPSKACRHELDRRADVASKLAAAQLFEGSTAWVSGGIFELRVGDN